MYSTENWLSWEDEDPWGRLPTGNEQKLPPSASGEHCHRAALWSSRNRDLTGTNWLTTTPDASWLPRFSTVIVYGRIPPFSCTLFSTDSASVARETLRSGPCV